MAALKYERFIVKMSMEQKLRLITSTEFYKSDSVGGYGFPVFEIKDQPYGEHTAQARATRFPCDLALASSWNTALVEETYNAVAEETRAVNSFAYYNCTADLQREDICAQPFVLGKFLAGKVAGLRRGGGFVNFEEVSSDDGAVNFTRANVRDIIFSATSPSSVITSDLNGFENLKNRFTYKDKLFGVVSTVEEALDFLYSGCSFLFLQEDIYPALVNEITDLTEAYKLAHKKFCNDQMSESAFARLVRNFKVFDPAIIDKACDDVVDIVFTMKSYQEGEKGGYNSVREGETADFDEINHAQLAYAVARQCPVLIKNDGGVLPVSRQNKIAVIGECAKNISYQNSYGYTLPTEEVLPFDAINGYGLNTVGFALGYAKGEVGRSDLIDSAISLCRQADTVFLYLAAEKGAKILPVEQQELLNAISGLGAKVIAVVSSSGELDLSFADRCAAVLLTYDLGQGGTAAVLDLLCGEISPSGRLTKPAGVYLQDKFVQKYPVGYGLSYTQFVYENLKVNEAGVSVTVKNVGKYDGYALPQMYVKKKNTNSVFAEKVMRGFTKVFVKAGDAKRVKIPFDELTFRQYDENKGYFIEGGLYNVSVGDNANDEKASGILLLKEFIENKRDFDSKVLQTGDNGKTVDFSESGLPEDIKAAKKKLPFSLKLTLAIIFAVYVDAVLCVFAFTEIIPQKQLAVYIIIGVVALIVNALTIVYICLAARNRKKEKYLHPNVVLSDMLENVEEFTEIAKVKYRKPIEEDIPVHDEEQVAEGAAEEVIAEDVVPEEEQAAAYEVKFDDAANAEVTFSQRVSYSELCRNLHDYAATKGVLLEMASSRALFAALSAGKIVFLTSKNAEVLPDFIAVLNSYFGNENLTVANDEWHSPKDLLWVENDGKYVLSPFSNAVYAAYKNHERQCAVVVDNVNINNLGSYFVNFLDYANHPTEEHILKFNDETSFRLPDNVAYILAPQGGVLEGLPQEILNASLIVDVMLTRTGAPVQSAPAPAIAEVFAPAENTAAEIATADGTPAENAEPAQAEQASTADGEQPAPTKNAEAAPVEVAPAEGEQAEPAEPAPADATSEPAPIEITPAPADVAQDAAVEPEVISREDFAELLQEAKQSYFLSEKVWKKIDSLVEAINANERFVIGNKNILQLEKFTSVLLDCGCDEADAITEMFLSKLVYALKNTRTYKRDDGEKQIFSIIEKLFTDEELTKIQRALSKAV